MPPLTPNKSPLLSKLRAPIGNSGTTTMTNIPRGPENTASAINAFSGFNPPASNGQKTVNPAANITQPVKTLDQNLVDTTSKSMGNNPVQTPASNNTFNPSTAYADYTKRLGDLSTQQDPGVLAAQQRERDLVDQYQNTVSNIGTRSNPFGFATGMGALAQNRFIAQDANLTAQIGQAQTEASRRAGLLGSAANASTPAQNGYALLNRFTGQPTINGSSGNGGAGLSSLSPLLYDAGRLEASQAAGGASVGIENTIQNARNSANQFSDLITKDPGFNSGQFVWGNALQQLLSGTFSSPTTPGIQAAFSNTISQYGQLFPGGQAQVQNLIKGANPNSMQSLIKVLDNAAQQIHASNIQTGMGGGVTASPPSSVTPPITTPGGATVHEGDVHVFNGVTYKNMGGNWVKQ